MLLESIFLRNFSLSTVAHQLISCFNVSLFFRQRLIKEIRSLCPDAKVLSGSFGSPTTLKTLKTEDSY